MQGLDIAVDAPPAEDDRRYRTLLDNLFEGFVICEAIRDGDRHVVDYWLRYANPVFIRRAPAGDAQVGKRMLEIRPGTRASWFASCERALDGGRVRFEFQETRSGRWYEVHMVRMSDNEFAQLYVDVTNRRAAEQRQADLLRELNHRVKNNLAVVSAILSLQARSSPPDVREHLARAVDRVQSIALLHELLYRQDGADHVELEAYLKQLAANLERSMLTGMGVRLAISCAPLQCPVKVAVNLGLIVNELVTNAAKHAYGETGGEVRVSVTAADGELRLVVSDDGKGFPEGARVEGGLGLRLVRSLTKALDGSVGMTKAAGGRVEVVLPLTPGREPETAQQRLL